MASVDLTTLDRLAAPVLVLEPGGTMVHWNRACSELTGRTPEEVRGVQLWSIVPVPEEAARARRALEELRAERQPCNFESTWPGTSGEPRTIAFSGSVVPRDDGEAEYLMLVGMDVTPVVTAASRRESERLRQTVADRELFKALIDNSSDFIGIADPDGKPVYVNPAGRRMVGLPPDYPVESTRIPDYYPPDRRSFVSDVIVPGMTRTGHWKGETHFLNWQTGEAIPVSDEHFLIREPGTGRVLGLGTITRDISDVERARAEASRLHEKSKFVAEAASVLASSLAYEETLTSVARLAVEHLADLCVIDVVDEDGHVRRLRVVSRDPANAWISDVLARTPLDRSRPHLAWSALETRRPIVLRDPSPETIESMAQSEEHLRALRALDVRSLIVVPFVAYGKLLGAMALVSSAESRYGEADLHLAEDLARQAALAIEHARLYREAQRAVQARDEVLAIVAHDLRGPLNTLVLHAQDLPREQAIVVERAATRMDRLVRDLLDVTSIEAGRLSLARSHVPVNQLLADSVRAQDPLVSAASLELTVDIASDLPDVCGDHDRLLQVLDNLVGNAVKFTPAGGRITVGARPGEEDQVLFWVSDTGDGIAAAHVPNLFDPFWQARKGDRRGAGLGLSIVKGIIDAHDGRVWVESEIGRGTTVTFTVPVAPRLESPLPPVNHRPRGSR